MTTVYLDGIGELQALYDSIVEDFEAIDYGDWLTKQLEPMADLHKRYFDSSTGPDGAPWQPNAPSTIRQKGHSTILRGVRGRKERQFKATNYRPRVRFRQSRWIGGYRLSTSLTARTTQSFGDAIREAVGTEEGGMLKFGTSVEYAIYNDQGTSRIPARPHIGLTGQFLDKMAADVADFTIHELATK